MNMVATNPKQSVVSVWFGGSEISDGQFIGSGFFITPSLILTAKHVVRDKQTGQLFSDLYLKLVSGRDKVWLEAARIYCNDELDIALIQLAEPDNEQHYCELDFISADFRSQEIDIFGINDTNKSRDSSLNSTTGILDQQRKAYRFNHRVKKGFSGGAVALHNQAKVMGVICQRDREDQETLYIPVYKCRDWFESVSLKLKDADLARYLPVDSTVLSDIQQYINRSALFIGRPQEAYQHILTRVLSNERPARINKPVKACFCLYASDEDQPLAFADALGMRLEAKVSQVIDASLLESSGAYLVKILAVNPWDYDNKERFFIDCLASIVNYTNLNINVTNYTKPKDLCQSILQEMAFKKTPIILISDSANRPIKPKRFKFQNKKTIAKINQRFAWVEEFDKLWMACAEMQQCDQLILVLIFCLRADDRLAAFSKHCFRLQKITSKEFKHWTNDVHNLLRDFNHLKGIEVGSYIARFHKAFVKNVGGEQVDFQISYTQFVDHTQTITNGKTP